MASIRQRVIKIFGLSLVFLASLGFVFLGMGDLQFGSRSAKVAQVDGHAIDQTAWDNAHRQDMDRMLAANPNLSLAVLDSPAMKYASLQRLVRDDVLAAAARHGNLLVSDAELAAALQQNPTIAALRSPDGQIDMKKYTQLLSAQGLTPQGFEAGLRADLERQQVLGGVQSTELASTAQIDASMDALRERREAQIVPFLTKDYAAKVDPTERQLTDYYKAHLSLYQAPETVDIQYIVLDVNSLKKAVQVNDEDLRKYYEQNAAALGTPEERQASHILVAVPKGATEAQRDAAKAKAEKLLEDVRAHPDQFAAIARKSSEDPASAPEGGNLGFFTADKGMDPAIAKAAFELKKVGDISGLVKSEFGYHIIELTAIKPSKVPPFDQVRAKLEDQLRTQEAQQKFAEVADEFKNGVYEQADSLKPTADKLGLTIESAKGVTQTPAPGAQGALANPKFLDALFSADVLGNKHNTEAIEIGANALASGHVTQHTAAHAKSYDEVKATVREQYVDDQGAQMAREAGEKQLKAWTDKPDSATGLPPSVTLSRQDTHGEPAAVIEAVMRADPGKLPAFVGVDLGAGGYSIARVDKVLQPATPSTGEAQENHLLYNQLWSAAETQSLYDYLQARYKAKILVPLPTAAAAGTSAGNPP